MSKDQEILEALDRIEQIIRGSKSVINNKHILTPEPGLKFQVDSETYSSGIICGTQVLQLHMESETWIVRQSLLQAFTSCKLTPCIRTDLKPGDIAVMSDSNPPNLNRIGDYKLILSNNLCAYWFHGVNLTDSTWTYHWKMLF